MTPKIRRYSYDGVPTIAKFAQDDSFVRCLMGPFSSGKSTGCVAEIIRRAEQMPIGPSGKRVSRWAVVRNTFRQLEDTTIRTFHDWVPPRYYGTWRSSDNNYIIDKLHPDIELEIWFRAMDRPDQLDNLLSTEYTGAWINEAREVPREIFDGLTGRVGRYPREEDVPGYWSGIILDTNPPDTDSWIYKLFEEDKPDEYRIFKQPAADGPNGENLKHNKPEYYERMKLGKSRDWIKIYVQGQYGFADAGRAVYPEYSDTTHVAEEPIEPSESFPIYVGVDWGLTPAALIGQLTSQRWVILDELLEEDADAVEFARHLKAILNSEKYAGFEVRIWGDPAGEQRAQTDSHTPFMIFASEGLPAEPAYTPGANPNDFALRRAAVARRLTRLAYDGQPQLLISPTCVKFRKAMAGGYCFRRVTSASTGQTRDKPDKGPLSHIAEAGQYLLVGAGEAYEVVKRHEPEKKHEEDEDDNYPMLDSLGWMAS